MRHPFGAIGLFSWNHKFCVEGWDIFYNFGSGVIFHTFSKFSLEQGSENKILKGIPVFGPIKYTGDQRGTW